MHATSVSGGDMRIVGGDGAAGDGCVACLAHAPPGLRCAAAEVKSGDDGLRGADKGEMRRRGMGHLGVKCARFVRTRLRRCMT